MKTWIEQLVPIHKVEHLLEHGPLQDLAEDGQDGNRSVILGVEFTPFPLVEWHHLCNLPLGGKLLVLDRKVKDVAD